MTSKTYQNIFEAIIYHNIEAAKTFLPEHANAVDDYGNTALQRTIFAGDQQIFDLLLDNGAAPYAGTVEFSILWDLRLCNWPDKIQTLVDHGLDIHSTRLRIISDICRYLGRDDASFDKDLPFLKELIRRRARTDIPDEKGKLPLDILPDEIRTEIDKYIANLETERQGNIAHDTEFAYDI